MQSTPRPADTRNTTPIITADMLQKLIKQDQDCCQKLLVLLEEEQEALKNRDADKVDQLLDQKVPLLEQLEKSAKFRAGLAQSVGTQNRERGWQSMLETLGASSIKNEWANLKTLFIQVRKQNEINGRLLSRHQQTIGRLLDLVR